MPEVPPNRNNPAQDLAGTVCAEEPCVDYAREDSGERQHGAGKPAEVIKESLTGSSAVEESRTDPDIQTPSESEFDGTGPAEATGYSAGTWLVSLSFWCMLLIAGTLYGAASLSPKLADWLRARDRFIATEARIEVLNQEVDHLQAVVTALEEDSAFATRMAEATWSATAMAESTLPEALMSSPVVPGSADEDKASQHLSDSSDLGLMRRGVRYLVLNPQMRTLFLWTAAGVCLFAFTFLNESGAGWIAPLTRTVFGFPVRAIQRYQRRSPQAAESADTAARSPVTDDEQSLEETPSEAVI